MPVFLKVKDGERFRDVAVLVPGEPVTIGRVESCDVSFPDDLQMSSRHASLEVQGDSCLLKDLKSTNGTRLNDERIESASVAPSDVIRCGGTEFAVEWSSEGPSIAATDDAQSSVTDTAAGAGAASKTQSGLPVAKRGKAGQRAETAPPAEAAPAQTAATEPGEHLQQIRGFTNESAAEIIERFALPPDDYPIQPDAGEPPETFAQRLLDSGEPNASLKFLAYALPRRCAVWWLVECVRQGECIRTDADLPMLEAAAAWVKAPSEAARRKAFQMAEELEMETPAALAGVAAFWSDGSMAPPDVPPVPPAEDFTGKAVSGGVILATVLKEPEKAMQRQRAFTELGLRIAGGEAGWDEN